LALRTHPRSQVTPRTVWTVAANVMALVALLWLLTQAWTILSWMLVALFLALAAHPVVRWLERQGAHRSMAVAAVFLLGLGLVTALVMTLVPMLIEQGRALVQAVPAYIEQFQNQPWVERLDERYDLIDRISTELRERIPVTPGPVLGVVTNILQQVAGMVTIAVLTLFFLLFGKELFDKALLWVEPSRRENWKKLAHRMHSAVGRYLVGTLLVSFIGGAVTTVTLLLLGVPYFLPLGLAMAMLGLVPFVGAALGAVLVVGTTFASAGLKAGIISLGVFLAYQQVEGHLLQPLIQRQTLKMNPLLIALVMLLGTSLAGILGALLALPVAGAIQVLLQDRLRKLNEEWRSRESDAMRIVHAPEDPRLPRPPSSEPPEPRH